jgi:hypothetical protein
MKKKKQKQNKKNNQKTPQKINRGQGFPDQNDGRISILS